MADQQGTGGNGQDSAKEAMETAATLASIAERSQKIVSQFLADQSKEGGVNLDPLNVGGAFLEMTKKMMEDPQKLFELQTAYWQDYMQLWQNSARQWFGEPAEPTIEPERGDRRFKDEGWSDNAAFDFIKQSYLLTARYMQAGVQDVEGLDDKTAKKVDFYTKQFVDAMSPSNFAMTNPEVLRATFESKGENLVRGLEHLVSDLERGKGRLAISMTDMDAFEVGDNIAVTPGKVVYQNDLIQLLQYTPTTEKVYKRPLLIIPPWINKFYILDLRPKNSFIKWATDQGLTVFVVSWVNPNEKLSQKTFEDYMVEGPLAAMDAIEQATGERELNAIGYCLGGTLMASTLAYMSAKGTADRVKSITYFTTLVDFDNAGDLCIFIDDEQLASLEQKMSKKGYLEAADMSTTFNMLRANDLIWSFVINNYLLGKDPFPFDLLYWNSDSTRMPAAMHSFYLRNMYQNNLLTKPGGISLKGTPIDLAKIETPTFILSTKEDHIAPWKATYSGTQLYGGTVKFCLSGSGHIAGVVNPEGSEKYGYWTYGRNPKDPDAWFEKAKQHPGSWWPEWGKWIGKFGGGKVAARVPGDGKLKVLEDAPGSYVKTQASSG